MPFSEDCPERFRYSLPVPTKKMRPALHSGMSETGATKTVPLPSLRKMIESGLEGIDEAPGVSRLFRQDVGLEENVESIVHVRNPGKAQNLRADLSSSWQEFSDRFLRDGQG